MPVQSAALNTDNTGKDTSAYYGDPGDGSASWYLPAKILDGGDVAQGDRSDAAANTGDGTVIALLKALRGATPGRNIGGTPITGGSGNVANASAVATLAAGGVGVTTWISGFTVTAAGATAGANVQVTVAGLLGGSRVYVFNFPTGATVGAAPLNVQFPSPIPASGTNTAITVTVPAAGAGNTHAAVVATGFTTA